MNVHLLSWKFAFRYRSLSITITQDLHLMRSQLKISLKSFKNLLTSHAEDMKLIVDAILRRSHHEFFLRSSFKLFLKSSWDLKKIFWRFIRRFSEDFIRRSSKDLLTIFDYLTKKFKIFLKLKLKKGKKIFSR
jgi:hypothetical protein